MPLTAGARLGPYEVVAPLGAGGMGEVYRARDTRLDRTVAIKVLPAQFDSDPERRARFEREAKAISSLNHPHICALYDVGNHNGADYLVMEHLQGETLQNRLRKGPLPLSDTLRFGVEIADALDKAHRQGLVHRDLKPGNVMLTKAGAKLLDFGLATASASDGGAGSLSAVITAEKPLTGDGALLGTFQYMAPEQLEGGRADARSDIWALGCVIYEMAAGRRAFDGKSQASLIGAILKQEPQPLRAFQPLTPPSLERLVRTCLTKDPDDRWQSAHDIVAELRWVTEAGPAVDAAVAPASRWSSRLAWLGAGLGFTALVATLLRSQAVESHIVRFDIPPPEGTELGTFVSVSPDGRHVAFTASDAEGTARLFVRTLDSRRSAALPGSEGVALQPFWSPDSRSIGFHAQGKLLRVDVDGAAPQTICAAPELRGATWNEQGTILFAPKGDTGLFKLAATGGNPEPLTSLSAERRETSHRWPHFLPDGQRFLYMTILPGGGSIRLGSLSGEASQPVLERASAPLYSDRGYLVFVGDGALRAQAFDVTAARLSGEPVTLAESIDQHQWPTGAIPASAGGSVLAYRGGSTGTTQLAWVNREGLPLGTLGPPGLYQNQAFSPDGRRVAVEVIEASGVARVGHLSMADLASGSLTRFTFAQESDAGPPCWSPDGRFVAYTGDRSGRADILLAPASGSGTEMTLVHDSEAATWSDDISPDGRYLLYERTALGKSSDLWLLPLEGDRQPKPFLVTDAEEVHGQFSPDGRWLAYTSDASGRPEIYVRSFPEGTGPWLISTAGGDQPQWRRDGQELFYLSQGRQLMAVSVDGRDAAFRATPPRALFRALVRAPSIQGHRNHYAVAPDGKRFLLSRLVEDPEKATITVVLNWPALLKGR